MISFATLPVIVTYINLYSELRNSAQCACDNIAATKRPFFSGQKAVYFSIMYLIIVASLFLCFSHFWSSVALSRS